MPQKSTYFHPKAPTGLAISPVDVTREYARDTGESERMDPEPPSETAAIAGNGRGYHDGDNGRPVGQARAQG